MKMGLLKSLNFGGQNLVQHLSKVRQARPVKTPSSFKGLNFGTLYSITDSQIRRLACKVGCQSAILRQSGKTLFQYNTSTLT